MRRAFCKLAGVAVVLALSGCLCVDSMQVVTDINPVTGAAVTTHVEFSGRGQCEVQYQIQRAVRAFSTTMEQCGGHEAPARCRAEIREAYRPHIYELIDISHSLASTDDLDQPLLMAQADDAATACEDALHCIHP